MTADPGGFTGDAQIKAQRLQVEFTPKMFMAMPSNNRMRACEISNRLNLNLA